MKEQKALEILKNEIVIGALRNKCGEFVGEAVSMAIVALEKQMNNGWIPCKDKLPDPVELDAYDMEPVVVTYLSCVDKEPLCKNFAIYCTDGEWRWFDETTTIEEMDVAVVEITAWQPLPKPWKGEE